MPNIESEEQQQKAIQALREYYQAKKVAEKAAGVVHDKLGALKTITGITSNAGPQIEEEVLLMLGRIQVIGLPEQR